MCREGGGGGLGGERWGSVAMRESKLSGTYCIKQNRCGEQFIQKALRRCKCNGTGLNHEKHWYWKDVIVQD